MNYSDWASCFHNRLRSVPAPQPRSPPGRCSYMGGFLTTASLCCCEQQAHTDTAPHCPQLRVLHTHFPTTATSSLPWRAHTHTVPLQGHCRLLASSLCSCDAQRAPRGAQNWHSCHRHSELLLRCHAVLLTIAHHICGMPCLLRAAPFTQDSGLQLAPATDTRVYSTYTPGTCQTHATQK